MNVVLYVTQFEQENLGFSLFMVKISAFRGVGGGVRKPLHFPKKIIDCDVFST